MKELSIEEKARRYDEVKNKLSRFIAQGVDPLITRADVQDFFPELKESEDEMIRKEILEYFQQFKNEGLRGINISDWIAWLEKQGYKDEEILVLKDQIESLHAAIRALKVAHKIELKKQGEQKSIDELTQQEAMDIAVAKCFEQGEQKPVENRQETKPNGGIVCEDFNDGDGYYKVNLAYLSKPQVELIENLVDSWQNPANNSVEWSEEDEKRIANILSVLSVQVCWDGATGEKMNPYQKEIDWLKSLKQRTGG